MNNLEQFITHVLLNGFKGFKNMEYWEIEFFLHQHKWADLKKKEQIKNDRNIGITEYEEDINEFQLEIKLLDNFFK